MHYLSNGCSHSSDIGPNADGFHQDNYTYTYLLNEHLQNRGGKHSWKKLQHPGKSNGLIFHETLRTITKEKKGHFNFATIQFSSANRRYYQLADGQALHINPYDWTEYGVLFEPQASFETLNYIFSLQKFFTLAKTPYLMMCYFPIEINKENKTFVESMIDLDRFVSFDDNSHPIFDGWIDKMKMNKTYVSDEQGHPSFEGHKYIFSRFRKKLSSKLL